MEECKWSIKVFGMYIQYTKLNKLQILRKKEGQWVSLF